MAHKPSAVTAPKGCSTQLPAQPLEVLADSTGTRRTRATTFTQKLFLGNLMLVGGCMLLET